MNNIIFNIACSFVMALMSLQILKIYFETFLEMPKTKKKIIWFVYFIWPMYSILQPQGLPIYLNMMVSIALVFCVSMSYEGNPLRKIIFAIMYVSIWIMLEFLVGYVFIILKISLCDAGLIGSLVSKLLLLILVKILRKFFDNEYLQEVSRGYNIAFMLALTGSIFVVYESFSCLYGRGNIWNSFAALFIMLVTNVLMFNIYLRLSENFVLKRTNMVFKQTINLSENHLKEKEESLKIFRQEKHNLKHRLICIKELLQNEKYGELEKYIDSLLESGAFTGLLTAYTDNTVIDTLVNYKYTMARKNNIDFYTNLQVPTSLPFDSSDLCIILGNALDNALEASLRVKKSEERFIKLFMRMDSRNLIIIIENYFDGHIKTNKQGKILSIKEDAENHGIGLLSIQKAIDKYHGCLIEKYEENIFLLKIILYS